MVKPKALSKEELKQRLMNITSANPVPPVPALAPPTPPTPPREPVAAPPATAPPRPLPEPIQPMIFSKDQPPPETPAPLRKPILGNTPKKRRGMKSDPNCLLKGLYLELAVAKDLADFAGALEMEQSRLANSILKAAFADETAPEDLIPALRRVRAMSGTIG